MTGTLIIDKAGPSLTVQDQGRLGFLAQGLSASGAADQMALMEGAALLGQSPALAALEMVGMGGTFRAGVMGLRIALTGAPMKAAIDGAPVVWSASHRLEPGQVLTIGGASSGTYGYLHVGGGIDIPPVLGARSTHLVAGIGSLIETGAELPVGKDTGQVTGLKLSVDDRFSGGAVRLLEGIQTDRFSPEDVARFQTTSFERDSRSNRMGVRLGFDGPVFAARNQLNVLSEVIVPGDIQITGDGPFVLLPESQTTGGYPRIGTVIPSDLPKVAQTAAGGTLTFRFVTLEDAIEAERKTRAQIAGLTRAATPLIRDPHDIDDLLSYQLISGVTAGTPEEGDTQ